MLAPAEVTPAAIAAYLEGLERRQEQQAARLRQLEGELQEARRDPLADLVTTETFVERYDFSMHQLQHWLKDRHRNGASAWVRQGVRGGRIRIDLHEFHRWFAARYDRATPERRTRRARP